ncbi:MAG TPA: transposase [Trebonia sp.]
MLKGSVEGWFVPEAESSGFSSSRAILKTCGSARGGRTELLAFFDFPAEHWIHLRTTNPIESTFSTVRLRTKVTRGAGSRAAALAMVFKLVESARQRWQAVNAPHLVALVRVGARFERGRLVERSEGHAA